MIARLTNGGAGSVTASASGGNDGFPFRFGPSFGGHPLSHWAIGGVVGWFALERFM